ncbi:hypothetical protein HN873_019686, partial [Arachis hypogaea]
CISFLPQSSLASVAARLVTITTHLRVFLLWLTIVQARKRKLGLLEDDGVSQMTET